MSTEVIEALLAKRAELVKQAQTIQSSIYHLDETLAVMGHAPQLAGPRIVRRKFANGELMALVGEAERAGLTTAMPIAIRIMQAKGWDVNDDATRKRVVWSVKECRKRMNARGV